MRTRLLKMRTAAEGGKKTSAALLIFARGRRAPLGAPLHITRAPTKILFSMNAPTQCRLVGAPIDGQIFLSAHCKILENL